jgi:hypothetical protein
LTFSIRRRSSHASASGFVDGSASFDTTETVHTIAVVAIQRTNDVDGVSAVMPLRPSSAGGSGSFLVLADDGHRYWCKSVNNFQGERIPITEQIVSRLASLIGAPACEPRLVDVTPIAGWEFRPGTGRVVEAGWAHGSRAVEPVIETRSLDHQTDDDNARRQAGIHALCDWLAGGDVQWLYCVSEENAYYSHDHGFYLTGPAWTEASLTAAVDTPVSALGDARSPRRRRARAPRGRARGVAPGGHRSRAVEAPV